MHKFIFLLITIFLICSCSTTPREEPFTVALDSPRVAAGSAEAYIDRFMGIGSLNRIDITVSYYPMENAVGLHFYARQFINCNQFWDKAGRDAFITAFERYKSDYEQRKLVKGRKSLEAYGSVAGYFAWKRTSISVQAYGPSKVKMGYYVKDKAAFFSTTQLEATFEDPISQQRNQTSAVTTMYFTRAQAEALAELFKQEHLQGLLRPAGGEAVSGEVDGYEK